MKVLIVEDNAEMRRLIVKIVLRSGITIFECEDDTKALLEYRKHLPDWVLMDIKMRELNGISTACQILVAFPKAKIVIISDYYDESLRSIAYEAGAFAYIVKENLIDLHRLLEL